MSKIFQIFSSLPLLSGSAASPKNVMKNDAFYGGAERATGEKNDPDSGKNEGNVQGGPNIFLNSSQAAKDVQSRVIGVIETFPLRIACTSVPSSASSMSGPLIQ